MDIVAKYVRDGMASNGVSILGADYPCFLSEEEDEPSHSVDLQSEDQQRVWDCRTEME